MARTKQSQKAIIRRKPLATMAARIWTPASGGVRRPHRYRPGTVALREIRKLQKTGDLLIPRAPFERLCRELMQHHMTELRLTKGAIDALQTAAETRIVQVFAGALEAMVSRKGLELEKRDLDLFFTMEKIMTEGAQGLPKPTKNN